MHSFQWYLFLQTLRTLQTLHTLRTLQTLQVINIWSLCLLSFLSYAFLSMISFLTDFTHFTDFTSYQHLVFMSLIFLVILLNKNITRLLINFTHGFIWRFGANLLQNDNMVKNNVNYKTFCTYFNSSKMRYSLSSENDGGQEGLALLQPGQHTSTSTRPHVA